MKLKASVINLSSRPDRRKQFEQNIKEKWNKLNYSIFNAICPAELPEHVKQVFGDHEICQIDFAKMNLQFQAKLSCSISHLTVIKNFINHESFNKYDAFLVMEDDCVFLHKMNSLIEKTKYPEEWDFLYFYADCLKSEKYNSQWRRVYQTKSTSCYVIHRKFIKKYHNLAKRSFIKKAYYLSEHQYIPVNFPANHGFGNEHIWSLDNSLLKQFMKNHKFYAKVPKWTKTHGFWSSINNPKN